MKNAHLRNWSGGTSATDVHKTAGVTLGKVLFSRHDDW